MIMIVIIIFRTYSVALLRMYSVLSWRLVDDYGVLRHSGQWAAPSQPLTIDVTSLGVSLGTAEAPQEMATALCGS